MPRPVWKGHISFGLVNIPVSLYNAERKADLKFNLIDSRDQARVRYERVNADTGEEVPWSEIVRGFEYEDGNYVLLEEADFKRAAPELTQTVDIQAFVDRDDIDPLYFEHPYYLVPEERGARGYALLRESLEGSGKAGIARVVIRHREYLAAVLPWGDALVLNLLRFEQEIVDPNEFEFPGQNLRQLGATAKELDLAEQLIEALSRPWQPEQYHDQYRAELLDWIDKKIRVGETTATKEAPPAEEETTEPEAIMELLELSLQQHQTASKS